MQQPSNRGLVALLVVLGVGCSADKSKDVTGPGNTAGDDGGASGGKGTSGGNSTDNTGNATAGNNDDGGGPMFVCIDRDKDTYGERCEPGPDCDDKDDKLGGYEICDGKDNDCDGKKDEFLTDVCTECDSDCQPTNEPPNDTGWTPIADKDPKDVQDVIIDDDGAITLSMDESQAHAIWVANTGDLADVASLPVYARGSVSKLDSKTNRELARYISVLYASVDTAGNPTMLTDMGDSTPNPSRTAVDQRFDAYVANRAHSGNGDEANNNQQTVTKYADDPSHCVDRNNNGMIDTSSDIDGNGTINTDLTLPVGTREFWGTEDECILWTVKVGDVGGWARALAVGVAAGPDQDVGSIFVGLYRAQKACELNAETGATIQCVDTPNFRSYGAAADSTGRTWFVSRDSGANDLGFLENGVWTQVTNPNPCGNVNDPNPYGMTVDADNRVYIAMANCPSNHVSRYDHDNAATWTQVSIPGGGTGRGAAVSRKHLWVAISGAGTNEYRNGSDRVEQFDLTNLAHIATHRMPNGRSPVGIGVSFDGSIWAINQDHGGNNDPFTASGNVGIATRLDLSIPDGTAGHWIEWPVGKDPYTYSDFIGFGLNTFADPKGFYRFVIEGCPGSVTHWRGVQVNAETPKSTSVQINVRSADSKKALAKAKWQGPFDPPAELKNVPDGTYLEVEVVLATDDQSVAPRVFGVEVIKECESVIQ